MKVSVCIGPCAISGVRRLIARLLAAITIGSTLPVLAQEAVPAEPGEVAQLIPIEQPSDIAGHAHRVETADVRSLDPALFTELRPVTVDAEPVRLPPDQALDE